MKTRNFRLEALKLLENFEETRRFFVFKQHFRFIFLQKCANSFENCEKCSDFAGIQAFRPRKGLYWETDLGNSCDFLEISQRNVENTLLFPDELHRIRIISSKNPRFSENSARLVRRKRFIFPSLCQNSKNSGSSRLFPQCFREKTRSNTEKTEKTLENSSILRVFQRDCETSDHENTRFFEFIAVSKVFQFI